MVIELNKWLERDLEIKIIMELMYYGNASIEKGLLDCIKWEIL